MRLVQAAICLLLLVCGLATAGHAASALEPIIVPPDRSAIDLTRVVSRFASDSDRVQVTTAPAADGIVRRIEVRGHVRGPTNWAVFALTNQSDEQIDRLLVAPHYRLTGSGLLSPDLGSQRLVDVTSSQGFRPDREDAQDTDIFRVTLDPGATVTFVAELGSSTLPQLHLWDPDAYKDSVNDLTLYKGIVLGIAGLLAMILTIVFVVKGSAMFPAAAALAWAVLVFLAVDFGFWHKIFDLGPGEDHVYRAGAEAALTATMIVFLVAYLNLNRWHVRFTHIAAVWLVGLVALFGIALIDAPIAAGIARISLLLVAVLGFGVVVWLALHNFDRAVMLIPTWFLLITWVAAGGLVVSGVVVSDLASPTLTGGLVLLLLLIALTVMQHAFAGAGLAHGLGSDLERRALALTGAGDIVWDWDVSADRIHVTQDFEYLLGLKKGDLHAPAASWLDVLHPADRDRFRTALDLIVTERRGRLNEQFRFRAQDGHYVWMLLRVRPVVAPHGEVTRCVGTMIDITQSRQAEERLLSNAVQDNLTGLPNRQLFLDRIESALSFAEADDAIRLTIITINLDEFRKINEQVGQTVGDTLLLTLVRRMGRLLKRPDALARLGGDEFGILLLSETDGPGIGAFADALRKALASPISFSGRDIVVTGSIGLVMVDPRTTTSAEEAVRDAEMAMLQAKRMGGDRTEIFKPSMRTARTDRSALEGELRRALEREELRVLYRPVVRLEDRTIVGFEGVLRWEHPRYRTRPPAEFLAVAEEIGLIVDFSLFALDRASRQLGQWQRRLPVDPPLFLSVNLPAQQFDRQDLLQDLKTVLSRATIVRGSLKLELTETVVVQNPERAAYVLERLRELGVGLALDDFGTGHASLGYLQRFAFDTVKMDRSFLRQQSRTHRMAILRSMIQLGRELGLDVIAEGAETDSDAVELYQLGCQFAQGAAFGEAMTAEAVEKLLGIDPEKSSPISNARRAVMGALRTNGPA
ncbi:EAL domain-containing protein [Terrihabitans sp. B22-R8]|uniref:EAL domain-containing protein n=1 Tax=Terrihabitans sp. B22-R8 TaxID=3425128 RepID=UPI00403C116C